MGSGAAVQAGGVLKLSCSCPRSGVTERLRASHELGLGSAGVSVDTLRQEWFHRAGDLGLGSALGHQERLPGGGVPEHERAVWKLLPLLVFRQRQRLPVSCRPLRHAHSSLHVLLPVPHNVVALMALGMAPYLFLALVRPVFPVSLLLRTSLGSSGGQAWPLGLKSPVSQSLAAMGISLTFIKEKTPVLGHPSGTCWESHFVSTGGWACSNSCWLETPLGWEVLQIRSDQGSLYAKRWFRVGVAWSLLSAQQCNHLEGG